MSPGCDIASVTVTPSRCSLLGRYNQVTLGLGALQARLGDHVPHMASSPLWGCSVGRPAQGGPGSKANDPFTCRGPARGDRLARLHGPNVVGVLPPSVPLSWWIEWVRQLGGRRNGVLWFVPPSPVSSLAGSEG